MILTDFDQRLIDDQFLCQDKSNSMCWLCSDYPHGLINLTISSKLLYLNLVFLMFQISTIKQSTFGPIEPTVAQIWDFG